MREYLSEGVVSPGDLGVGVDVLQVPGEGLALQGLAEGLAGRDVTVVHTHHACRGRQRGQMMTKLQRWGPKITELQKMRSEYYRTTKMRSEDDKKTSMIYRTDIAQHFIIWKHSLLISLIYYYLQVKFVGNVKYSWPDTIRETIHATNMTCLWHKPHDTYSMTAWDKKLKAEGMPSPVKTNGII